MLMKGEKGRAPARQPSCLYRMKTPQPRGQGVMDCRQRFPTMAGRGCAISQMSLRLLPPSRPSVASGSSLMVLALWDAKLISNDSVKANSECHTEVNYLVVARANVS